MNKLVNVFLNNKLLSKSISNQKKSIFIIKSKSKSKISLVLKIIHQLRCLNNNNNNVEKGSKTHLDNSVEHGQT